MSSFYGKAGSELLRSGIFFLTKSYHTLRTAQEEQHRKALKIPYERVEAMHFNKAAMCALLSACLLAAGCAKIPDKLISPIVKIEQAIKDNTEHYILRFNAGIQNENSSTALMNVTGAVSFVDPDGSTMIMSIPFELPVILPLETGIIELTKTYPENEIMPLVILLGSDKEKLLKDKGVERSFFDDKIVKLEISGYKKDDIRDVLKDKLNEKN